MSSVRFRSVSARRTTSAHTWYYVFGLRTLWDSGAHEHARVCDLLRCFSRPLLDAFGFAAIAMAPHCCARGPPRLFLRGAVRDLPLAAAAVVFGCSGEGRRVLEVINPIGAPSLCGPRSGRPGGLWPFSEVPGPGLVGLRIYGAHEVDLPVPGSRTGRSSPCLSRASVDSRPSRCRSRSSPVSRPSRPIALVTRAPRPSSAPGPRRGQERNVQRGRFRRLPGSSLPPRKSSRGDSDAYASTGPCERGLVGVAARSGVPVPPSSARPGTRRCPPQRDGPSAARREKPNRRCRGPGAAHAPPRASLRRSRWARGGDAPRLEPVRLWFRPRARTVGRVDEVRSASSPALSPCSVSRAPGSSSLLRHLPLHPRDARDARFTSSINDVYTIVAPVVKREGSARATLRKSLEGGAGSRPRGQTSSSVEQVPARESDDPGSEPARRGRFLRSTFCSSSSFGNHESTTGPREPARPRLPVGFAWVSSNTRYRSTATAKASRSSARRNAHDFSEGYRAPGRLSPSRRCSAAGLRVTIRAHRPATPPALARSTGCARGGDGRRRLDAQDLEETSAARLSRRSRWASEGTSTSSRPKVGTTGSEGDADAKTAVGARRADLGGDALSGRPSQVSSYPTCRRSAWESVKASLAELPLRSGRDGRDLQEAIARPETLEGVGGGAGVRDRLGNS